jgi:hypothetical protein
MSKEEAKAELAKTRILSTNLLKPLGLSFEVFLRFAQVDKDTQNKVIDKLIA